MTDERRGTSDKRDELDDLLSDLDTALSVQASPSVAARVRTRIEQRSTPRAFGLRLLPIAGAMAAIVLAVYVMWPRPEPARMVAERPAVTSPSPESARESAPTSITPTAAETPVVTLARRPAPAASANTTQELAFASASQATAIEPREPEVIVSPSVRLGIEQLQAAVMAGRISAESFLAADLTFEPTIVTPLVIEIQPFEIQTTPVGPSEAGSEGDTLRRSGGAAIPIRLDSPLSRTRSTL